MKILILGHNGLLGNMVYSYFKDKYDIITTNLRWESDDFKQFIIKQNPDFIINCIGIIPQRKPAEELYMLTNYRLPVWLDSLGIKIIHPDTDESADTPYGLAKKMAKDEIINNTKILKTSIMGFEKGSNFSFLEWFLTAEGKVNGYTNQFWNGNTTLEWTKWAERLILDWNNFERITILVNPECVSKYEILLKIKKIFNKDIEIIPTESIAKYNCMNGLTTPNIEDQLIEMKKFCNR